MADSIDCSGRGMVLNNPVICIVGPTASGKSELAQQVALRIGGEVISADSVQVYRGLDIGSAKLTPEEMQGIPHHLIDVLDPEEPFNITIFQKIPNSLQPSIRAASRSAAGMLFW